MCLKYIWRKICAIVLFQMLFLLFVSCQSINKTSNISAVYELPQMNVLYIGIDNPIKICASARNISKMNVTINNGTISGCNGNYVIRPEKTGTAILSIYNGRKILRQVVFRVKTGINYGYAFYNTNDSLISVSDVNGKMNVSKKKLTETDYIKVVSINSDFDLKLEIIEFVSSPKNPTG